MKAEEIALHAGRMSRGLLSRLTVAGLSALLLGLILGAVPAGAENVHTAADGVYGKEGLAVSGTGTSCRIGYQEAEKRLYLMSDGKIYGLEITAPGTAAELPGYPVSPELGNNFYCSTTDLAVDNTSGTSKGRYYVTRGGSEITAFNPNGTKVGSPWPVLSTYLCSTTVLPSGEVLGYSQFPQPPTISRYTSSGEQLKSIPWTEGGCPQMAVDPTTSDLYVSGYFGLRKYTAASDYASSTLVGQSSPYADYAVNGALHKAYVTEEGGTGVQVFDTDNGEKLETIPTGGEAHSVALDEASDTLFVQVGNGGSGRIEEFPPSIVPTVTTGTASSEGLVEGTVEALDEGAVTGCIVEYGFEAKPRTEAYEHTIPCAPATPYAENSTTPVTAQLTGLIGETPYHYRIVAENATGKGFGRDMTFTPHYVQGVVTESPTSVTTDSATLNASFDGNSEDTEYFFEWGLAGKAYEHTTPVTDAGSPATHTPVSGNITGLTSDTAYHYRVVMENPKGESPGNDVEFSSANAVKSLGYEPVSELTSTSVTLNGSWVGEGTLDTEYFFEWGFDSGTGFEHSTTVADGGSSNGPQIHSAHLASLVSNANYRYRIIARNSLGTSTGAMMTFKTLRFPSVVYKQPSEYGPESVVLNAMVNPNGGGATTFHFEYGLTTAYGSSSPESSSIGSDSSEHLASAEISGLQPGTTYHYRIVATAPGGSYVSPDDQVVTTLPIAPTISESTVSERSPTAATINTDVKPGFGSTVVFFRYGPSASYNAATVPGPALVADNEPHPVGTRLEGLKPDTLYHYQVVAINFNGSTTSTDHTFETGGTPRIGDENATGITDTSAQITAQVNPNLSATSFHIEYGTTSSFGSSTAESATIGSDETKHSVTQSLTGLTPGTIYHYRVVGTNAIASGLGEEETFRTAPAKTEPPLPVVCKKGFVKRHGKCVKKPKRHHKKRHHKHRGRGGK